MRLLLDTHALLWWWNEDRKLSREIYDLIAASEIEVSAVSAFEIATKHRLGKLPEADEILPRFDELMARDRFNRLLITHHHAMRAGALAASHADPFDRLLAAQAELEGLVLVTKDSAFAAFPCATRW